VHRKEVRHLTRDILRIGHRGAPSHFWENTVRSLQKAIEIGVDMVEFDIQKTLDDHFVLCHSSRLGRFFPFSGRVARKRMGDLIHHTVGNGEPIARLQDAIAAVKGRALMNIDLKSAGGEEKLVDVIVESGVLSDVLISSHHGRSLRRIKELEPAILTGLSLPKDLFHLSAFERILPLSTTTLWVLRKTLRFWILRQIERAQADAVMLYYKLITPKIVAFLEGRGVPVYAYTVDDPKAMRRMMKMGVRGIASNRPELLVNT
jgi:glycerophosphoryl diester phosphodiesterase